MDDDVDPLARQAEEEVRLDDLEALVHHRRRVDRDLRAHLPGRVRERVLDRDRVERVEPPLAERAARGGQDEALRLAGPARSAAPGGSRCARSRPARARRRSRVASARMSSPATTSGSLLASASRLPARTAACAERSPRAPTSPPTTVSASDGRRPRRAPPRPTTIRQPRPAGRRRSSRETSSGRSIDDEPRAGTAPTCSASLSIERPAASATTRKRSGNAATTSSGGAPDRAGRAQDGEGSHGATGHYIGASGPRRLDRRPAEPQARNAAMTGPAKSRESIRS